MKISEAENYFKESLNFFDKYRWLFKYPVTEILVHKSLDSIPDDWVDVLKALSNDELNNFTNGKLIKDNWPKSLISFVEKCKELNKLSISSELVVHPQLPQSFTLGLSAKKQHEIFYLSQLVNDKCMENNVRIIVDLGAGLGYICQLLNYLYNYTVIGLESNENNVKIAEKRQNALYPESINYVKFTNMKVTYDCEDKIIELINELLKKTNNTERSIDRPTMNFCLIGLHACADLSVNACKLFSKMNSAKILLMVSCCYHKLEMNENNLFTNFPSSNVLQSVYNDFNCNYERDISEILSRPFLRLACQEPSGRWENMSKELHDKHALYVLARAVIELFTHNNGFSLKKCVRKATRKAQCLNFGQYLTDTLTRYTFNNKHESNNEELIQNITHLWLLNQNKLENVEIYTALQYLLQMPAESLVLYDRYCWLLENNSGAEIITVLNSKISPRCYAIIGKKS